MKQDHDELLELIKQSEANALREMGKNNSEMQEQIDRLKREVRKAVDAEEDHSRNL